MEVGTTFGAVTPVCGLQLSTPLTLVELYNISKRPRYRLADMSYLGLVVPRIVSGQAALLPLPTWSWSS